MASAGIACLGVILGLALNGAFNTEKALAARPAVVKAPITSSAIASSINIDSLYKAKADEPPVASDSSFSQAIRPVSQMTGHVSWYGPGFHGRRTASGEIFDKGQLTAAHKTLPFGTFVRVSDPATGRTVLVRINDRGPYVATRVLDLSEEAARQIRLFGRGTGNFHLEFYLPSQFATAENQTSEGQPAISFDDNWKAVRLHGYTVNVLQSASFEKAVETANGLRSEGRDRVYVSRVKMSGKKGAVYQVSVGLYDTPNTGKEAMAGLQKDYKTAQVTRFQHGLLVTDVQVTDGE